MPRQRIHIAVPALFFAFGACWAHRTTQQSRTLIDPGSVHRCVPEYPQLGNAAAKLPPLPEPQGVGNLVIIGYVSDSGTGRGLSGARVLLRPATQTAIWSTPEPRWHDTTFTDSAAGFVFSSLKPGSYEYIAQSLNFQAGRGSVALSGKAETLRIRLRRAGLCDVITLPLLDTLRRPPPR